MFHKSFIIIFLFLVLGSYAHAYTFSEGDLNFETTGEGTCRLTASPNVSGILSLPKTVSYERVTYSVTAIGEGALADARTLEALLVPETVTEIGKEAMRGCTSLRVVELGEGIREIGNEAFVGCTSLESVKLPASLTIVPRRCFYGDRMLTKVVIGPSTQSISTQAFDGCMGLKSVVSLAAVPPSAAAYSFDSDAIRECVLTVPSGCRAAYTAEKAWSGFKSIVESDYGGETTLLTIMFPDGFVGSEEALGSRINLTLSTPTGWKIDGLYLNGEDVTSDISWGGYYTTPPLFRPTVLSLVVKDTSGVADTLYPELKVKRVAEGISITGTDRTVTVYSLDGKTLFNGKAVSVIPLENKTPVIVIIMDQKYIL